MPHGPFVKLTVQVELPPGTGGAPGPVTVENSVYLRGSDIVRIRRLPCAQSTAVMLRNGEAFGVEESPERVVELIKAAEGPEQARWRGPQGLEPDQPEELPAFAH